MKPRLLILSLLMLIGIKQGFGCNHYPIAIIEAKPVNTVIGLSTVFFEGDYSILTDSNTHYQWNFGDGSPIDTSVNPSHNYKDTGTFIVTLIITNDSGCSDTARNPITIMPAIIIDNPIIFSSFLGTELVIPVPFQGNYNFQLVSLPGKTLFTKSFYAVNNADIVLPAISQGIYIMNITSGKYRFSDKIFIP